MSAGCHKCEYTGYAFNSVPCECTDNDTGVVVLASDMFSAWENDPFQSSHPEADQFLKLTKSVLVDMSNQCGITYVHVDIEKDMRPVTGEIINRVLCVDLSILPRTQECIESVVGRLVALGFDMNRMSLDGGEVWCRVRRRLA